MNQELEKQALEIERNKREDDLLKIYNGNDKIITSHELKEKLEIESKSGFTLQTQFSNLNSMFDGFREGNLIIISGYTGEGKTQFCQDLTRNFVKDNISTLWFSFEMGHEEFLERFKEDTPLFYIPAELKTHSLKWFKDRIRESILKYNTKVIFIDHLHFMIGMKDDIEFSIKGGGNFDFNLSSYLGLLVREIKKIAVTNKLVIFLISHPRKADELKVLTMEEIGKDSVSIVQEADSVISIWREKKKDNRTGLVNETGQSIVTVLKNRRKGKLGHIKLNFNNGHYEEFNPESTNIDWKNKF